MVPSSQTTAPTSQQQPRSAQPNVFEFTKRKKWADILVTELPETVLFILDSSRRIQYSGAGVREMLGWEVETLVDSDVLDLINDDDKQGFRDRFQISLNSQQELSCYARLKCKLGFSGSEQGASPKELLFEIRGHALYIQDDSECKCFFFMAKPYPSRNMAILNTFLELKIENERLTQRLYELKAQQEVHPISSLPLSSSVSSMSHSQFTPYIFAGPSDEALPGPSTRVSSNTRMSGNANFMYSHVSTANTRDEQEEEGGKRKKPKKSHLMDHQYVCVTCGRTDSPEWRKGPKGPKTLCNACGLRWAKRAKKADDVLIPGYGQVTGHDSQGPQGGQDIPRVPASGSGSSANRGGRGAPVPHAALSVTPTTSNTNSVSSHRSQQSQHSQHSVQVHPQISHAPSSAHISLNHAPSFQPSTTVTMQMSASGHYSDHSPHVASSLHHSDPHSSAPTHGYPASHDLYQGTYEQYAPWLANQPHGGYPGY